MMAYRSAKMVGREKVFTCSDAAEGHLEVLKWFMRMDKPISCHYSCYNQS
jgi:hypothetical protein